VCTEFVQRALDVSFSNRADGLSGFSAEPFVILSIILNAAGYFVPFISGETASSILCPKAPCAGTLLCELGLRLESLRVAQNALIRPALSRNQVLGRSSLKQAGRFEANPACVVVGTKALNHRNAYGLADRSSRASNSRLRAINDAVFC
jgi:hypothetical protein